MARAPGVLARRVDPRAGVNLVWGEVHAGTAANVIPRVGVVSGTLRLLDRELWEAVPTLLAEIVRSVAAPYGVDVEVTHVRGVPPVVNDAAAVACLRAAAVAAIDEHSVSSTEQSLGGEDFGWMLEKVPGALARLGVRPVGRTAAPDLHHGAFDVDERCIGVGVRLLAQAARN
jgi:metal-dependent amidase/aminoacylase/carboxypeptidase family protein